MRLFFYLGTVLVCLPSAEAAEWVVQTHQSTAEFKSWGKDCPPNPKATTRRRGQRYTERNQQLIPQGDAYPIFSDGVCARSTGSISLRETRSRQTFSCTTPEGHPIFEGALQWTIRTAERLCDTRWSTIGDCMGLIATSQREAWQLSAVQPNRELTLEAGRAKCATPGKTARISVRKPSALRVQSGQTLRMKAWPIDAEGCTTRDRIVWKTNGGKINPKGELTALNVKTDWLKVTARVKGIKRTLKVKVIPVDPPIVE